MEDLHDKDLISQMREVLHEHEEPYAEGAWEEFSGRRKSAPLVGWKWFSVAAAILVIASIWILYPEKPLNPKRNTVSVPEPVKIEPKEEEPRLAQRRHLPKRGSEDREGSSGITRHLTELPVGLPVVTVDLAPAVIMKSVSTTVQAVEETPLSKRSGVDTAKGRVPAPDTFIAFLNKEQALHKSVAIAKVSDGSKWDFGVEILPTVSNSAVNVGAGLTTEYKVSEHFSVGSGISLVQLQAVRALTPGVSMLRSRQLQSVDANFKGIDIPLNLVYNINKSLYTSIGVSYFNVIQENSKNTFVAEREYSSVATDPVTGLTANVRAFVSETVQEPGDETMLNGKSYLGFLNFSIGRKQEVFGKYNIFIEPFIKLPVGKLSQQDLQLTNGGMKFKIAF